MLDRLSILNLKVSTTFTADTRIYKYSYDVYAGDSEYEFDFTIGCAGTKAFTRPCGLSKEYVLFRLGIDGPIDFVIEVYESLKLDVSQNLFRAMEIVAEDNGMPIEDVFDLVKENDLATKYINDIQKYMVLV